MKAKLVYRNYIISPDDFIGTGYMFTHDSYDGEGDHRCGHEETIEECIERIDEQIDSEITADELDSMVWLWQHELKYFKPKA